MPRPKVSYIAIGSELLSGAVTDSNSSYLAKETSALGFQTERVSLVDDIQDVIVGEIEAAVNSSDVVFTTGGLGPTSDDCTRQAVAQAAGVELQQSEESVERLKQYASSRGRALNANSLLQALFPKGAEILINEVGTADAFITLIQNDDLEQIPVISLPGPPSELRHVFGKSVRPYLEQRFGVAPSPQLYLRCFGLSESHVGTLIDSLKLPEGVSVAYRPTFPELLLTLSLTPAHSSAKDGKEKLRAASSLIEQILGAEFIFARESPTRLSQVVANLLREKGLRLSAAESCTGGMLSEQLVAVPGASSFLLSSLVTYSNSAKEVFLGVKPALLEAKGAVSEEVAKAMAYGAKNRIGADIAVSTTGIAGPDGGSEEKPVGTLWIGLAYKGEVQAFHYQLPFERNALRLYATNLALDLIRRKICELPLTWSTR